MKKSVYSILACGAALLLMACDNDVPVQATYSRMPGESCDAINDCDKAFLCIGGICRIPCTTDEGCSKRQNCINNFCANTFDGGCRIGWSGTSCEICADNYYGGNCQPCPVCGEHGKCDDTLTGDGHCQCNTGWEGPACDECANGYGGDECAPCDPIFTGKGCTQCRDPRFSGPRCDECIDGATDTVQGKDGHNYTTICFNKQFWMAENMADNFGRYIPTGHSTANNVNYGLL